MEGSTLVGSTSIGGLDSLTVVPVGGAGGDAQLPGTYSLGNHRGPFAEAGVKAHLRVHDPCSERVEGLAPLDAVAGGCGGDTPWVPYAAGAAAASVVAAAYVLRRRRGRAGTPMTTSAPSGS